MNCSEAVTLRYRNRNGTKTNLMTGNRTSLLVLLLSMFLYVGSGCALVFEECDDTIRTFAVNGPGPAINNPVRLAVGSTYRYGLMSHAQLVDQEGGGRHGCPLVNRRLPRVDSLRIGDADVAAAHIEDTVLNILAVRAGSTAVSVHMSATTDGGTWRPIVQTLVIVE